MKKGTLITSSSLPAGDTEIHHHSTARRAELPQPPAAPGRLLRGRQKACVRRAGDPLPRAGRREALRARFQLGLECEIGDG